MKNREQILHLCDIIHQSKSKTIWFLFGEIYTKL